jgi:hypothetical protein
MNETEKPLVKVRINASGRRLVGCLRLQEHTGRTSDLLNGPEPFLELLPDEYAMMGGGNGSHALAKRAISYVEALEEPGASSQPSRDGAFHPVVAELHQPETQVIAELYVPEGSSVLEVLNDPRPFVSLRNVHFNNFVERYDFLAVGKAQLIQLKI